MLNHIENACYKTAGEERIIEPIFLEGDNLNSLLDGPRRINWGLGTSPTIASDTILSNILFFFIF
jgi:hypothetical protein